MADITNPTSTQLNPDLKEAFLAIKNKLPQYNLLYNYYKGIHPLKYSATRLKKAFERIDTYFSQNWVGVVIDSMLDRLVLKGFDVSDNDTADEVLEQIWKDYDIQLLSDDVHEAALVTGEAFVIALNDSDKEGKELPYDIYFNDPRMCYMGYEFDDPGTKRFAAKLYTDKDLYPCMTLYYPDRFEYYKSTQKLKSRSDLLATWSHFIPDQELPTEINPYGEIPVFHFMSMGRLGKKKDLGVSEISLQDAINKLLTDMLVSAEFNAFTQRIIISQADPGSLQNVAGANWWIPAGDGKGQSTNVLELGNRPLDGFLNAIDKLAISLAIISRTPKHYFFQDNGEPSGAALNVMEAPLVKKVTKRQERLAVEWQRFAKFILQLEDVTDVKRSQISPVWDAVSTVQPLDAATITKTETDSGIPLVTSLRRRGWGKDEIQQMEDDKKDEKKSMSGLAQDALDKLRAEDANNNNRSGVGNQMTGNNNQTMNNAMNNQMNNKQGM
jgi:hypothetical protein